MDKVYLTRDGLEKQRRELKSLIEEIRPEATHQLEIARQHGDLSENAEYDAAREKLTNIDRRIAEMQQKLARVQLIDQDDFDQIEVRILSRVKMTNVANGMEIEYTLVDPVEANPTLKRISVKSPIGAGLLGLKVGEVANIEVPSGQLQLRIDSIERSEGV